MKKFIVLLLIILSYPTYASKPYPEYYNYNIGYNNGYNNGYNKGKYDTKVNFEKAIVAVAIIGIGVVIIYNVATHSKRKVKDITHYSYEF